MWHLDIVCNLCWLSHTKGDLGVPLLKQALQCEGMDKPVLYLVYGTPYEIKHLRVVFHVESKEMVDSCIERNLQYWIRLLEATTSLVAEKTTGAEIWPGTNSILTFLGEGGEESLALGITPKYGPVVALNTDTMEKCLGNWKKVAEPHLFYFSRFMNASLPVDVRWLHGYKLAEWHFQRGGDGLAKNPDWQALVSDLEEHVADYLRPRQKVHNLIERARAIASHAISEPSVQDERLRMPGNLVQWTFPLLEHIVMHILNLPELSRGVIKLKAQTPG
jgi:hypothetical protein